MIDFITQAWAWYVAGPIIALIMFLLLYFGESFGMSSNLRTMCTMAGGDKFSDFFKIDWRKQQWNLVFALGAILGGFIAAQYLSNGQSIDLNPDTIVALEAMGFQAPSDGAYLPAEIFSQHNIFSLKGFLLLLGGGFLVGFGARYAGGCTSGHAISGLSNLQIPSFIAVIGFFIGGLLMTHVLLPIIF